MASTLDISHPILVGGCILLLFASKSDFKASMIRYFITVRFVGDSVSHFNVPSEHLVKMTTQAMRLHSLFE